MTSKKKGVFANRNTEYAMSPLSLKRTEKEIVSKERKRGREREREEREKKQE